LNKEKLLKILGTFLVTIAVCFIFQRLWIHREWILKWRPTPQLILFSLMSILIYVAAWFLMTLAWFRLLIWYGQSNITFQKCLPIYARTQIAKYIPGNVFHFAGRHLLGRRMGLDHGTLIGATLSEIIGQILASSSLGLMGLLFLDVSQKYISSTGILAIFIMTILFPVLLNKLASKVRPLEPLYLQDKTSLEIIEGLLPVHLLYVLFFLILGGLFLGIVCGITDLSDFSQAGSVITIFSVSWLVGFITPGSPGGMGVREAIIVASLTKIIGEPESLFVAFLFRIICVLGDLLFFMSSFLFGRHLHIEERK